MMQTRRPDIVSHVVDFEFKRELRLRKMGSMQNAGMKRPCGPPLDDDLNVVGLSLTSIAAGFNSAQMLI